MDKRTELALELGQTIYTNTINDLQARVDEQAKELEALRELLLKSSNHLANVDNMTAAKWGVVGINIINEITQTLEKSGNPTKLLKGEYDGY